VSGPQNPNEKNPELKIYLSHQKNLIQIQKFKVQGPVRLVLFVSLVELVGLN
jgi:hypothetical protein